MVVGEEVHVEEWARCWCVCVAPSFPRFFLPWIFRKGRHTSEIPFLWCLLYSVVHAIRRGFLRWRKRDSVLPFWKRKILLSPRT